MKRSTTSVKHPLIWKLVAICFWLAVWQLCCLAVDQELLLVSPAKTLLRIFSLAQTAGFWATIAQSVGRIGLGFLLGLFCGTALAFATAHMQAAYELISLPMSIVKATPVASFVILALVWIKGENLSVFIAFLMVLPMVWTNLHTGILSVDRKLCEMAQVYQLPHLTHLRHLTIPAALPYFLSAAKVGLGFAWKAGIAGEVIAIPTAAIGTRLYDAKVYLETADLFAWTAVIILLSVLLERVMVWLLDLVATRMEQAGREGA